MEKEEEVEEEEEYSEGILKQHYTRNNNSRSTWKSQPARVLHLLLFMVALLILFEMNISDKCLLKTLKTIPYRNWNNSEWVLFGLIEKNIDSELAWMEEFGDYFIVS